MRFIFAGIFKNDKIPILDSKKTFSDEGFIPDWAFMRQYIETLGSTHPVTANHCSTVPNLNINEWKFFPLEGIVSLETTTLSIKSELEEGKIPFVSRTAINNGCDGYVDVEDRAITKGNCLSIGAEGIYAFYQPYNFATGNKVYVLKNRVMNKYIGLFLCSVLNKEDFRYSYGRARVITNLKREKIKLPVKKNSDGSFLVDEEKTFSDEGFVPDFDFMEHYIKSLPYGDCI